MAIVDTHRTVLDLFLSHEQESPTEIFLRQPNGLIWNQYTWQDAGIAARHLVTALRKAGLKKGDRIALLSQNCAEWIICDLAIMMGGFVSVPLYANVNASTMHSILLHAEVKLLLVGKLHPIDWKNLFPAIPDSMMTIAMNGYEKSGATPWNSFVTKKEAATLEQISPEDILTIIYTSGTTGKPKGVVHTHQSIMNALNVAAEEALLNQRGNRFVSYLPLSHAAERGLVEFGAMYSGGSISFIESQDSFASNIKDIHPTHFFGVPRIWEKFQSKIWEVIPQKKLDFWLGIPVLSTVMKAKIRKSLGLNKAAIILTGAAPISVDLLKWFAKIGIHIQEAYGMSENFNVCSINPRKNIRIGTVGKVFPNQEISIVPETHEIIQKCDWLMQGYYKEPELTASTIQSGYLHTGDMGELSADGYLKLTGRVKDIFKTSKGEYIAPGPIEMFFLANPAIDQACVMGVRYPQPFIVVVLSAIGKATPQDELIRQLTRLLNNYNQGCMQYQELHKVIIAHEEWTNENGLLTPTLKMKRNALSEKYEEALAMIYDQKEKVSWEVKPEDMSKKMEVLDYDTLHKIP